MESRDVVSVSRLVSRPIFASLGLEGFRSRLGIEDYRSRSQACCLETMKIARVWLSLSETSVIQQILSVVFAG